MYKFIQSPSLNPKFPDKSSKYIIKLSADKYKIVECKHM